MPPDPRVPPENDETRIKKPHDDADGGTRAPHAPADAATMQRTAGAPDSLAAWTPEPFPTGPNFAPPSESGDLGTLGPYRISRQLGRGGRGVVYVAVDTRLNRKLALKVMLQEFAADE